MPQGREDVVGAIRDSLREIEEIAAAMPEAAWTTGVHENGWLDPLIDLGSAFPLPRPKLLSLI